MGPFLVAGATALIALWLWCGRGRRVPLLRSTDASGIAALNRAQITALLPAGVAGEPQPSAPVEPWAAPIRFPPAAAAGERLALLRQLSAAFEADPTSRLAAVMQARAWGHPATRPLLHRALRDQDPAVVRQAALAMERFRGRPWRSTVVGVGPAQLPLPRNVARTR
jgi:hypothetical protein